jgi:hypothetical protein
LADWGKNHPIFAPAAAITATSVLFIPQLRPPRVPVVAVFNERFHSGFPNHRRFRLFLGVLLGTFAILEDPAGNFAVIVGNRQPEIFLLIFIFAIGLHVPLDSGPSKLATELVRMLPCADEYLNETTMLVEAATGLDVPKLSTPLSEFQNGSME